LPARNNLGITALSEYGIAARILLTPRSSNVALFAAVLIFAAYVATVVAGSSAFRVAIINYLAGLVFLAIALARLYASNRSRAALVGLMGLFLTAAASIAQQIHISIHPHYFNHNALYHLLEAIALLLIYISGRSLVSTSVQLENR